MKSMNRLMVMAALAIPALAMSGCGIGQNLVKNLSFVADNENGDLMAGFDTKVNMGNGALPEAKLPIYNPNSVSQFLGYIETHTDGTLSVRVDVTSAAKVQVTDGTLLPNGREIPVTLPSGVTPIAIPVINSNSKVYLAVGQQNIMAGVAVTLLADTPTGNSDWLQILQQLPANIFYPFNIATDLKGTAGVFTGDKVGIGVFAVKTMAIPTTTTPSEIGGGTISMSLAKSATSSIKPNPPKAQPRENFGVKTQYPTGSRMTRIQRALAKVRNTALD